MDGFFKERSGAERGGAERSGHQNQCLLLIDACCAGPRHNRRVTKKMTCKSTRKMDKKMNRSVLFQLISELCVVRWRWKRKEESLRNYRNYM